MSDPTHGFTKLGHAVHARVADHHPTGSRYQRFNKRAALWITNHVGTMSCAWFFCAISLCSLPATLVAANVLPKSAIVPSTLASAGFMLVVSWIAQSWLQLVLLPALMVGQQLQNEAADARAAKQFEDTELIADRVDEHTAGGIKAVLDAVAGVDTKVDALAKKPDA